MIITFSNCEKRHVDFVLPGEWKVSVEVEIIKAFNDYGNRLRTDSPEMFGLAGLRLGTMASSQIPKIIWFFSSE